MLFSNTNTSGNASRRSRWRPAQGCVFPETCSRLRVPKSALEDEETGKVALTERLL